ncbi:MAG: PKD domain-containing protein [Flavobacteriales bacterium]
MKKFSLLITLFSLAFVTYTSRLSSQCNTNTSICTPGTAGPFSFTPASNNPSTCLDFTNGSGTANYGYIILYITQSGPLNLLVNGNNTSGFIDVAVFNITGQTNPCASLSPATQISCNYASSASGCAQFGNAFPCPATVPAPNVTAGQVLMILVEDWSNAHSSFTLQLGPAPGAQTGPPDPTINPVANICNNAASIQLSAVNGGGTWSGPGTSPTGNFNPATAGIGTHTITYNIGTAPCNASSTTQITVIDCTNPPCNMNGININIGACNPVNNQYTITGSVTFTNPPAGGQLIIQDCSGNQQTFNAPFTSPTNFTIPGLNSNSQNCSITATFTSTPACTINIPYTAPAFCQCNANGGTVNASINGQGQNNYILCDGDQIIINTNNNYTYPTDVGAINGNTYNPNITYAIYTCPPIPGLAPDADPCYTGYVTGSFQNYTGTNNGGSTGGLLGALIGAGVNVNGNTLWFAPITLYNGPNFMYNVNCVAVGQPTQVTYLEPITYTATEDCNTGSWIFTFQGGYAAMFGGNFTVSNLSPGNASFNTTTTTNGGSISVTGLNNGDMISFTLTDANGCSITVNGGPYTCCSSNAGTTNANINGNGTNNYILCDGDQIDINSNNDFVLDPGWTNGGITYAIYTCPPTPGVEPQNDPCFSGYVTGTITNFSDINQGGASGGLIGALAGAGVTVTNSTLWFAPMTLNDANNLTYVPGCVHVGPATQVTYLEPINATGIPDCLAGTVTVTITGGYPQFNGSAYTISNVQPAGASVSTNTVNGSGGTVTINGLNNGDMYSITITDANGCPLVFNGGPFVGTPTANANVDGTSCTLSYSLQAIPSFGTGTWTGPAGVVFSPSANDPNAVVTVPSSGSYTFTWTESNGAPCIDQDQVVVVFSNLTISATNVPSTCGSADGEITVTVNGGQTNYSYSLNGAAGQANNTFINLTAGSYTVGVTDAIGCTISITEVINNLAAPVINGIIPTNPLCFGVCDGVISVNASGGTGAIEYSLDGITFQASNTFTNLCAGTYTITIRDANGCTETGNTTLTNPAELALQSSHTNLLCFQDNTGSITLIGAGGTGNLNYTINNGNNITNATGIFNSLPAGNYTLTVADANGCTATGNLTITEPAQLTLNFATVDATCNGTCDGLATAIPAGGTVVNNNYVYNWSPVGIAATNSPTAQNLCAGNYNLQVVDNNGCFINNPFTITSPVNLVFTSVTIVNEACNAACNGSITVTSNTGTEYSIDGVNFTAANSFNNLCAGQYTIHVRDANGCPKDTTVTITAPPVLIVSTGPNATICIGGTATLTAQSVGGTGNVTYSWDNGMNGSSINVSPGVNTTYCVTVTDANGCISAPACVDVELNAPLQVVAVADGSICPGGSFNLTANASGGGGSPYTYNWNNGVGVGQNHTVSPAATTTYTVTVSDQCGTPVATDQVTVTVNTLPAMSISSDNTEGCIPLTVTFNHAALPIGTTCLWSFGDGATSTDCDFPVHTYTQPGCFDVTLQITTPEGCITNLTQNNMICTYGFPNPAFAFGPQPTTIVNTTINFVNLSTGAISYNWEFGTDGILGTSTQTNPNFTFPNTNAGNYEVCLIATNAQGCEAEICQNVLIEDEFLIYVPNAFTPDGDGDNEIFYPVINGADPLSYKLYIFNRWGELIFESNNINVGWDGNHKGIIAKTDVYVWQIEVLPNTSTEKKIFRGHVSLLR